MSIASLWQDGVVEVDRIPDWFSSFCCPISKKSNILANACSAQITCSGRGDAALFTLKHLHKKKPMV